MLKYNIKEGDAEDKEGIMIMVIKIMMRGVSIISKKMQ
jgi:hypothetical protein